MTITEFREEIDRRMKYAITNYERKRRQNLAGRIAADLEWMRFSTLQDIKILTDRLEE